MKRLLMIATGVTVLALAVAFGGAALTSAQEGDGPVGTLLAKVAEKLGVSEDELSAAVQEAQIEMIDEAVADGRLTDEQAQRLRERVEEGGILLPHGPRHGPRLHMPVKEAALAVLGIDEEALREAVQSGQSLLDLAEAQGMTAEEFSAALLAEVQADLDAKVADGQITQEQADAIAERLAENIDRIINFEPGVDGFGGHWHGPRPFQAPPLEEPPVEETGVTA